MSQHTNSTVIIDTGCANLSSVRYAFERLTKDVVVSDDHRVIKTADRVVLPGVGTAGAAMASLKNKQLVELIQSLKQPVLGVCLGMQMMTDKSKELGGRDSSNKAVDERTLGEKTTCECLGLIPTSITDLDSKGLPLPHMGWNQISPSSHPLFNDIPEGSYLYFVHSYKAPLSEFTIATCEYGEHFSAAIAKDNFMGVQFHPEKSAEVGSRILSNFLAMNTQTFNQALNQTSWQLNRESRT
ncbi:imidazole glycerol phosphate synthase subunit HisH [Shewanella benthica]|uniref:imidazole glycerol phosphate synthase subunit HisH n=1 Tax=Shewanella benthica TaxID=43661 RepID=UPI001879C9A5|nr:imidazole glycerol phosphate synthase subunit HisH [Shewanella benthica]MBE7215250.1 imidazole glycerol phosphate synthase subunit HisH [Shewanella benthica]MCL1062235.1 imidazole glycerol phosphate synthase subunit HisH [Shewanella benthica]